MVESTCFQHTSSHPDKYNNSVDRIISKEEEREDPRKRFFNLSINLSSSTVVFPHIIQELQDFFEYYNYKAHPVQAPSSNCSPCLQAFYTAESSHKAPYSIPGPYNTRRLPTILPGRNSILSGSQHPRTPYSNSQASSTL